MKLCSKYICTNWAQSTTDNPVPAIQKTWWRRWTTPVLSRWVTPTILHLWPSYRFLGVPPGRGSCPLTGSLPFDLIYTDYHGLQQMKQHMGLSLRKYKWVFFFQSRRPPRAFFLPTSNSRESLVAFSDEILLYWLIGWLQSQACKFTVHQQNSPHGGGVQSGLFSTVINQVFSHTFQPRVIHLAHAHLFTIIKSICVYKWWNNVIQHPLILFFFFTSFSCCCFFTSLGPGVIGINPDRQQRKQIWHSVTLGFNGIPTKKREKNNL